MPRISIKYYVLSIKGIMVFFFLLTALFFTVQPAYAETYNVEIRAWKIYGSNPILKVYDGDNYLGQQFEVTNTSPQIFSFTMNNSFQFKPKIVFTNPDNDYHNFRLDYITVNGVKFNSSGDTYLADGSYYYGGLRENFVALNNPDEDPNYYYPPQIYYYYASGGEVTFNNWDPTIVPGPPTVDLKIDGAGRLFTQTRTPTAQGPTIYPVTGDISVYELSWTTTGNPSNCTVTNLNGSIRSYYSLLTNVSYRNVPLGNISTPGIYYVQIQCSNQYGSAYDQIQFNIKSLPDVPLIDVWIDSTSQGSNNGKDFVGGAGTGNAWEIVPLRWSTQNASNCTASGEWSGSKSVSGGSQNVGGNYTDPNKWYMYMLTCYNSSGSNFDYIFFKPNYPKCNRGGINCTACTTTQSNSCSTNNGTQTCTFTASSLYNLCTRVTGAQSCTVNNCSGGYACNNGQCTQLEASCSVSPTTITTGQNVTWSATASGGTGGYTFIWSGDDNLSGNANPIGKNYTTAGVKRGRVTVNSVAQSKTVECSNSVNVNAPRQECPTTCHTDNQNFPDGTGGTHSCPANAPARVEPPACRTSGGTLNDGKCSTYNYSANCSGVCSGNTCIVAPTVDLNVNFSTAPGAIPNGNNVIVTWGTTNSPTSCNASSTRSVWTGAKSTSGGLEIAGALIGPTTYTFTITCSNQAGSVTKSVPIYVYTPREACPTSCHTDNQYLPDGSGGTYLCAANQPAAESCPSSCHTDTQYKYDGTSCSKTRVCGPNAPAAQSCPSSCHTDTQYVSNGSCGQTTCPANNPARQEPPACRTTGGTLRDGQCSTYNYSANCTGVCSGNTCIIAPSVDLKVNNSNGPVTIDNSQSATLSWTTSNNPTSCSASGQWSGNKSISGGTEGTGQLYGPWTYTYTIVCSNAAGTSSPKSVTLTVNGPPIVSIDDQIRAAIEAALRSLPPGGIQ
ncbi:MAG: exported protein of unknown function [Microgenomates group bacterium Gr01-1014_7]|nr:MAG: exported protein of unknown function [Microgenomates group bacterium Gr01-1014_7]